MMKRASTRGTALERLKLELLGSASDELADELGSWLAGSRRFRAFAETHRDKIRKKLRGAADPDARRDVRAELAVAHLLLEDRRIELAFEGYGSGNPGPDFTVSFRGARSFNLEVTRPRRGGAGAAATILAKLRQLPPSVPNALLVANEGDCAATFDVNETIRGLRERATANDEDFFSRRGLSGAREFNLRYRRLGAVVVWCEAASGDARAAPWTNASARIPIPARAMRACLDCLRAD
jgi:hypothetical protein